MIEGKLVAEERGTPDVQVAMEDPQKIVLQLLDAEGAFLRIRLQRAEDRLDEGDGEKLRESHTGADARREQAPHGGGKLHENEVTER